MHLGEMCVIHLSAFMVLDTNKKLTESPNICFVLQNRWHAIASVFPERDEKRLPLCLCVFRHAYRIKVNKHVIGNLFEY